MSSVASEGARETYTVIDTDEGPGNMIIFSLIVDDPNNENLTSFFNFDPNTGTLSLRQAFDHDAVVLQTPITVRITACDVSPPASDCQNTVVTIFVVESNDNLPFFSQDIYSVTVSESFPVDEVLTTVFCTDADGNVEAFSGFAISNVIPEGAPNGYRYFRKHHLTAAVRL